MLVLDSGAVTRLAERRQRALALVIALRREGLWPPVVPSAVLIECLTGDARRDANANRLLKTCEIREHVAIPAARRAARVRRQAKRGSAVDALVVVTAEPDGVVLTGDPGDLAALASHSAGVTVERL